MSFERRRHQQIARVLECLALERLRECGGLFGGGTLIALLHGEFRLSRDVDFVCPVLPGYRRLRALLAAEGARGLFSRVEGFTLPRPARADQYGVRFPVELDGEIIKLEIFCEARIALAPAERFAWSPVDCLCAIDRWTEKLLANADRWADDSVDARDLIDLSMMRTVASTPQPAVDKATNAYEVMPQLRRAIEAFQRRAEFRARCFQSLAIDAAHRGLVLDGLDALAADVGLGPTVRSDSEEPR